jgi:hypothetical protein
MPPHRSRRQILLSGLRSLRYCCILFEEANLKEEMEEFDRVVVSDFQLPAFPFRCALAEMEWEEQEITLHELMELTGVVTGTRYMCDRGQYDPAMTSKADEVFFSVRELETWCHCTPASFNFIYDAVKNHEVFAYGGRRRQVDVKYQLFCALARLCCSGLNINRFASTFHTSHGSILNYTARVCTALNSIEKRYLRWPNAARRTLLGDYGAETFGFPGYIGQQDGTHFYFMYAPGYSMHAEAYYDTLHSGGYGYNVLLTADHTGSVIHYALGWPGQSHDSTIQQSLGMYNDPWSWFTKGEFLFVDAGFARQMWAVPPYKGSAAKEPKNKAFNHAMRRGRCRVEHVNAVLKSRFASLKNIPIKVMCDADLDRVNSWIRACLTLHNIFIRLKDEWVFDEATEKKSREKKELPEDERDVSGKEFQNMVRDRWLEANWERPHN